MTVSPSHRERGPAIVAAGLRKSFEGGLIRALADCDLQVGAGERVAIMGPTGCGKSTLLALLGLLDRPDEGSILLDGEPASAIRRPEDWRAAEVGIVFQLHHLLPHLTAEENVALPLPGPLAASRAAARSLLATLGLEHRARTSAAALSGGERQLVAVARALVNRPRLLLADEPTGSVDAATGGRILDVLLAHAAALRATVVLVTHDGSIAARLDRTIPMRDGRVVAPAAARIEP